MAVMRRRTSSGRRRTTDTVVWRNYVAAHARFFREGDVQGAVDEQECPEAGILVKPDLDVRWKKALYGYP